MKAKKLSGLFINCVKANDSIYESGKMAYQCLLNSHKYSLDYIEITQDNLAIKNNYDFYFFNYHIVTMPWLDTKLLRKILPGVIMTMVLEVSPNNPFVFCSPDDFDAYCVLDPTLNIGRKNVFAFPRPLETFDQLAPYQPKEIPVIGSFGFATPGKGFEHLIDAMNKEFDRAIVKINIPFATYADESGDYARKIAKTCKDKAKDGIEVIITHDFMSKPDLIRWCGQNTLNCFLYDRNMQGLAATTDQAITSGRPLIISKNNTFRHIQKFIKPFPYQTLNEAIANTQKHVEEMQREWSPQKFRERFEEVLDNFRFDEEKPKKLNTIELPLKKSELFQKLKDKVRLRTRLKNLSQIAQPKDKTKIEHKTLATYSTSGEDSIVYNLLNDLSIQNISYLEIGLNNPETFGNTYLFYKNGITGVLVEPDKSLCEKLKEARAKDIVLNVDIEITDIISNYFTECPDFVSINIKGLGLQILETLDFEKYNPAVFCVGMLANKNDGSTQRNPSIYDFLDRNGYFPYKETYANTIFLNKNLYDFYLYQLKVKKSEVSKVN